MKTKWFPIALICCFSLLFCTQCRKETTCDAIVKVYFSSNGIDAEEPASGAWVTIGDNDNYADFAKASGNADGEGIFKHTFKYEAALEVVATGSKDNVEYAGSGQIKLIAGEAVEIIVLMIPVG